MGQYGPFPSIIINVDSLVYYNLFYVYVVHVFKNIWK